jgi:hypothetical protein
MENILPFSIEQMNMLVRLLMAHLMADYLFQTRNMVRAKGWFSRYMFLHIGIVFISAALLTGWWLASLFIAGVHYLTDGCKLEAIKRKLGSDVFLYLLDQFIHVVVLVLVWGYMYELDAPIFDTLRLPIEDYNTSLIVLGYISVIWPVAYMIRFAIHYMTTTAPLTEWNLSADKTTGMLERVIILTMVLIGQYEFIGLMLVAKSIIHVVNKDEHARTQYVLVGTMMSYCMAIMIGVILKLLLI